jgi:hypothetical protein
MPHRKPSNKKNKPTQQKQTKKAPPSEGTFTKDDFLKVLKKVTRPITGKVSPSKGKSKTSG